MASDAEARIYNEITLGPRTTTESRLAFWRPRRVVPVDSNDARVIRITGDDEAIATLLPLLHRD